MHECMDSLAVSPVFLILNLNCGYCKVDFDVRDKHKTAFISLLGLYRFTQMLFELKSVPGILRRAMDVILTPVRMQMALVYFDESVIFPKASW